MQGNQLSVEVCKVYKLYKLLPFTRVSLQMAKVLQDRDVIAFVSGLNVEENAKRFAQKKGFYVLIPYGETMRIANLPDFEPKIWEDEKGVK